MGRPFLLDLRSEDEEGDRMEVKPEERIVLGDSRRLEEGIVAVVVVATERRPYARDPVRMQKRTAKISSVTG